MYHVHCSECKHEHIKLCNVCGNAYCEVCGKTFYASQPYYQYPYWSNVVYYNQGISYSTGNTFSACSHPAR
jgi:tRNA G26 N,N-dimethylase Trm1